MAGCLLAGAVGAGVAGVEGEGRGDTRGRL